MRIHPCSLEMPVQAISDALNRGLAPCRRWSTSRYARSRSARAVVLTRYAMPRFKLGEKLPRRPNFAFSCILLSLADAFLRSGLGGDIE